MISLKSVSKYYYQNGIVASGINKVSLDFKVGEFVAITGESGSGKSTLLNVISGLDSYEEGEMYIAGNETSHFLEKDYEDYRRKYIGNIFQNFNLIGSYSVYQNVELVLLLNGESKSEAKEKVLSILSQVGLIDLKNKKASKLSGGQKQRVAIARALAKNSPIIIADEPTGNLDSKSAQEIVQLLHQISKEKLVIIVTHNYEQVADYVTRKITMFDGKVLEDNAILPSHDASIDLPSPKSITIPNKIRLTFRNTFNIIPKFLLLFLVFALLSAAVLGKYSFDQKQKELTTSLGFNYNFMDTSIERLIIKHEDNTPLTSEDFAVIKAIPNVKEIVENDISLDSLLELVDEKDYNYFNLSPLPIENLTGELDYGRMPENDYELVIQTNEYFLDTTPSGLESLFNSTFSQSAFSPGVGNYLSNYKIVGIKFNNEDYYDRAYGSEAFLNEAAIFQKSISKSPKVFLDGNNIADDIYVIIDNNLPSGTAHANEDFYPEIKNKTLVLKYEDLHYTNSVNCKITSTLKSEDFSKYPTDLEYAANIIVMNSSDFNKLYGGDTHQSSVFVKDYDLIDETVIELQALGYTVLKLSDTLITLDVFDTINTIVTILMLIVLFFVSYFVIRLIMGSRKNYFTTVRILGGDKSILKGFIRGELLVISTLVYAIFVIVTYIIAPSAYFFITIRDYTEPYHILIVYGVILLMSYLLSVKISGKLFTSTAITTLNQEV